MFANINDIYLFVNGVLNKNQSGSISPADFSLFLNVAQQQYFRLKLGLPELYTVEKRQAPQEIQATQVIDDSVRAFLVSAAISKTGTGFTPPANLAAIVPSGYTYVYQNPDGSTGVGQQPIDFVTIAEWWDDLIDYVCPPTYEYPIGTWLNGQMQVAPAGIATINMIYYRYPITPVFAYTVNANDQIVYDNANSVQLEFPNLDWENIAWITVDYCSDFLREEFMKQAAGKRVVSGQ